MIIRKSSAIKLLFLPFVLLIPVLTGCAAKTEPWGSPEKGLVLRYRMQEGQVLKYQTNMEMIQKIEISGQPMEVRANENLAFSAEPKGIKEDKHQLEITIDSMNASFTTPQGEISPDMSNVNGKSFEMTLSTLGKESDLSGAEAIQYEISPDSTRRVSLYFQAIFPDLPEKPVKIGDTWTTTDTITDKSDNEEVILEIESVNKLDGFETLEGLKLAKITATVKGTFTGKSKAQGMDITSEGKIEGTDTWYFDYQEGLFIKTISNNKMEGSINIPVPNNPSLPITRESKTEVKLAR